MSALTMIPQWDPELGIRANRAEPVIVATDGRRQSDGALRIGRRFAGDLDALRVISVLKPVPMLSDAYALSPDIQASRKASVRRDVTAQTLRTDQRDVEIEVIDGDPATMIANTAHREGATLIVAGLGRHRAADRVFGDETALRLIRIADVRVFAAAEDADHAPRRIVVAVDFSETSLRAARMAIDLAAPHATIYVAHVVHREIALDWHGWGSAYIRHVGAALKKFRDQLRPSPEMTVQSIALQGDPATELLAFARSVYADLIATGSHGHGFVARLIIGSVATRIVRCASCSVLTVPRAATMTSVLTTASGPSAVAIAPEHWGGELDAFARRNFGRRATLEIDDPEIGAQAQEIGYPLLGAVYDAHDRRVELMLGEDKSFDRRLTRGIAHAIQIDILCDDAGRDLALRVAHGAGQTLLTFTE